MTWKKDKRRVMPRDLPGEEWRAYQPFPFVEVSNMGRIRSWDPHIPGRPSLISTYGGIDVQGYRRVNIRMPAHKRRTFTVHRLVATAFLDMPAEPEYQVGHLDEDHGNNRPGNLFWGHRDEIYYVKLFRRRSYSMKTANPAWGGSMAIMPY